MKIPNHQIKEIGKLAALGYSDAEIAEKYLEVRPETFCREKAKNDDLRKAIITGRYKVGIRAQEVIEEIMEYGTVEKNRLQAAMYLHSIHAKKDNFTDLPTSINLSFAAAKTTKPKKQIEKEAEEYFKDEDF